MRGITSLARQIYSSPVIVDAFGLAALRSEEEGGLARAASLNRAAYDRYCTAVRNARPGQLAGLISHAEFLKTGGKTPVDPLAGLRPAQAPAFGPANTSIKLAIQPTFPSIRRKPKG